jgi:hypothetical protein
MGRKILLAAVVDGDHSNERSKRPPITQGLCAVSNARKALARRLSLAAQRIPAIGCRRAVD